MCSFPSAMFEFFSISSEAWFLCNGLDLYYSVTNPFSSLKSRMFHYHVGVWSAALLFSCLPLLSRHKDRIYGFWFVNDRIDDSAVCWIQVNENTLSRPIWVLFFVPLMVIYLACCLSLFVAFLRLRRGITRTFLPRVKLLVVNTANVIVLILYWFVLIFFYSLAFFTRHAGYNKYFNDVLAFTFASKGLSALVVWLLTSDKLATEGGDASEENVDANKALREEVLNFATAGIRSSARASDKATKDRREITRLPQQVASASTKKIITPLFFIRFVMGQQTEVRAVETMVKNKRRSVNEGFLRQTIHTSSRNDDSGDDVELARMSQRPTELAGSRTAVPHPRPSEPDDEARESDADSKRYESDASLRPSEMIESSSGEDPGFLGSASYFSRFVSGLKATLLDSSEAVEFTEFEPYYFRQIRLSVGITDEIYIK